MGNEIKQDIAVYEKLRNNNYKIKIGVKDYEEVNEAWLEINWKRILNFSYYAQLKKIIHKPKICFNCEKPVDSEFNHIICPHCEQETGLWDSVEDIHNQKACIKKINDDIERTKMISFSDIKSPKNMRKGSFNFS